jgi:hypothetical protein
MRVDVFAFHCEKSLLEASENLPKFKSRTVIVVEERRDIGRDLTLRLHRH